MPGDEGNKSAMELGSGGGSGSAGGGGGGSSGNAGKLTALSKHGATCSVRRN